MIISVLLGIGLALQLGIGWRCVKGFSSVYERKSLESPFRIRLAFVGQS